MLRVETWDAGGSESYFYTEDRSVARDLKSEFPLPSVYFRANYPFAWQFVVPKRVVPLLKRKFDCPLLSAESKNEKPESMGVENKEVTSV